MRQNIPLSIGDSGWRAIYTDTFTLQQLAAIISALARLYTHQRVLIGYDNRFLSKEFASYAGSLLQAKNWRVDLLTEMFPTPGVGTLVKKQGYDWGLVITASHNPYYYNGLKILDRHGTLSDRVLNEELAAEATEILKTEELPPFDPSKKMPDLFLKPSFYAEKKYLHSIFSHLDLKMIRRARLKIAWDSFGGTTTFLFPLFLKHLQIRSENVPLILEPTYQKRRLEPDETSLKDLAKLVQKSRSPLGLASDIDGDRFVAVDEDGKIISNNTLGSLMIWYLLEGRKERGTIYQTVSCSSLTERICREAGVPCKEMPVGFQKMGREMQLNPDALAGIEETGGLAYAPHLCFKDGLLAHAFVLEMLASQKKGLKQLIHEMHRKYGKFYYHRIDLRLSSEEKRKEWFEVGRWEKVVAQKVLSVSTFDGTKWYFPHGWLLIRESKTEPLLRIYFESEDPEFVKKIKENIKTC